MVLASTATVAGMCCKPARDPQHGASPVDGPRDAPRRDRHARSHPQRHEPSRAHLCARQARLSEAEPAQPVHEHIGEAGEVQAQLVRPHRAAAGAVRKELTLPRVGADVDPRQGQRPRICADFEKKLGDNLYKLWSRKESGSFFPPPVKAVPIPKKSGGMRVLGVPTVADRVAQTVVKQVLEPILEPVFDDNSYGYRPGRSAHDAIALVRRRSWKYDWVVEFDIKGLFDHIDHTLLLRAVRKHCGTPWVLLYVERWLRAPLETENGERVIRDRGTPQGGVVSPLLANLFLHYAIDAWLRREMRSVRLCRYADDGVIHCRS